MTMVGFKKEGDGYQESAGPRLAHEKSRLSICSKRLIS